MNLRELHEAISALPEAQRRDYRKLYSLAGAGGKAWPAYAEHLEAATTPREFFEAVYADDACRFEPLWAQWARVARKPWVKRFEPTQAREGFYLSDSGVFLEGEDSQILIPMKGRSQAVSVYVFAEDGFNDESADLCLSFSGKYTCCTMQLDGTYDVYRAGRALIFEKWNMDEAGRRLTRKARCQQCPGCH